MAGTDFREAHVLADGTPVELRYLRRTDGALIEDLFARLSSVSRYRRFLGFVKELSPRLLHDLTDVDERDHVAILAMSKANPGAVLGVVRFIRAAEDPTLAEFAISVADSAEREGLGHILTVAIARVAVEHGIRRLHGSILQENHGIHVLLDEMGATFQTTPGGVVFEPCSPRACSACREMEQRVLRLTIMNRAQRAGRRQHTPWTYRRAAFTHVLQGVVVILTIGVGALSDSALAVFLCFLDLELTLLLVAPHVAQFRKGVDARLRRQACRRAARVRFAAVARMDEPHRHELERLEELVVRVRVITACDGDDWLGLDHLLAMFVRLAIAHRESMTWFDDGGPKRLEAQIEGLTADMKTKGDVASTRRVAILRDRLKASYEARDEQTLLLEQLATIGDTIRCTFEQAALGRSAEAQNGVDEAIAHCAGNGTTLRELAALRDEAPIDAETLRLGWQPKPVPIPRVRVALVPPPFHATSPLDGMHLEGVVADPVCASSIAVASSYIDDRHAAEADPRHRFSAVSAV